MRRVCKFPHRLSYGSAALRSLIVVFVGFIALPALAQHPTPPNDSLPPFDPDEAPAVAAPPEGLLHLDIVVTTPSGRPVIGLPASDFTLLDNGQPVPIVSFHSYSAGAAEPISVVVVLETLEVPTPINKLEHEHLEKFLRQNDGHLPVPVTVLLLSSTGLWRVGETTSNGNALADAVAHNRISSWDGNARGAGIDQEWERSQASPVAAGSIQPASPVGLPGDAGLRVLGAVATAERRNQGRKLLLWIGPAFGVGSGASPEELAKTSQEKLAVFDTIVWFSDLLRLARLTLCDDPVYDLRSPPPSVFTSPVAPVTGPQDLKFPELGIPALNREVLALESGGRVVDLSRGDPIAQLSSCVRDEESFYTLTFNPPSAQQRSEFHSIGVQLREPALAVRTSPGYYDQPWYSDPPDPSLRRLTVAQLDALLHDARTASDSGVARQLSTVQLTERATSEQLASWTAALPGKKSRQALLAVTDLSAFLPPPPLDPHADGVIDPAPNADTQREILLRAVDYVKQTIPHLPNFFARRTQLSYEETPSFYKGDGRFTHAEPLHVVDTFRTTVQFRNGREVIDAKGLAQERKKKGSLSTYGTFGPALGAILSALTGNVVWSGWEKGENGSRLAVFRYAVPLSDSRAETSGCCLPNDDGQIPFRTRAPYHGTVAIDPATGAVFRVIVESGLAGFVPVDHAGIMIAYGPVAIGGRTYICPVRSVSFMRTRSVNDLSEWKSESYLLWGPYATLLDDFRFDDYHIFRAKIRMILPGDSP